jgi:hypothetical protein
MAGYNAFQTGRVSFGNNRPKAPLVDIALVRPAAKAATPEPRPEPKVEQVGFIPPEAVRPEDFDDQKAFPMRRILSICAEATGVTKLEIQSHRRRPAQVKARQIVFWIARHHTLLSLPQISQHVGRRDHTTAMWGVRRVQAVIDRQNIEVIDCPLEMARRLWAAEWPKASV